MSGWDVYISNLKESCPAIRRGAIVSSSDGSVWAQSPDFSASAEELSKFAGLYNNLNDVPATGFHLEATKYVVPRCFDDTTIFGKAKLHDASGDSQNSKPPSQGVFAIKTKQAIVIAVYEGETAHGQECRAAVERMANYLGTQGY